LARLPNAETVGNLGPAKCPMALKAIGHWNLAMNSALPRFDLLNERLYSCDCQASLRQGAGNRHLADRAGGLKAQSVQSWQSACRRACKSQCYGNTRRAGCFAVLAYRGRLQHGCELLVHLAVQEVEHGLARLPAALDDDGVVHVVAVDRLDVVG